MDRWRPFQDEDPLGLNVSRTAGGVPGPVTIAPTQATAPGSPTERMFQIAVAIALNDQRLKREAAMRSTTVPRIAYPVPHPPLTPMPAYANPFSARPMREAALQRQTARAMPVPATTQDGTPITGLPFGGPQAGPKRGAPTQAGMIDRVPFPGFISEGVRDISGALKDATVDTVKDIAKGPNLSVKPADIAKDVSAGAGALEAVTTDPAIADRGEYAYKLATGTASRAEELGSWVLGNDQMVQWAVDPKNKQKIVDAYEKGYTSEGGTPFDPGGRAVWESYEGEQGRIDRALDITGADWSNLLAPVAKLGTVMRGVESANPLVRGAVRTAGEVLETPQRLLDFPADAVGTGIGKALPEIPGIGRLFRSTERTAANDEVAEFVNAGTGYVQREGLVEDAIPTNQAPQPVRPDPLARVADDMTARADDFAETHPAVVPERVFAAPPTTPVPPGGPPVPAATSVPTTAPTPPGGVPVETSDVARARLDAATAKVRDLTTRSLTAPDTLAPGELFAAEQEFYDAYSAHIRATNVPRATAPTAPAAAPTPPGGVPAPVTVPTEALPSNVRPIPDWKQYGPRARDQRVLIDATRGETEAAPHVIEVLHDRLRTQRPEVWDEFRRRYEPKVQRSVARDAEIAAKYANRPQQRDMWKVLNDAENMIDGLIPAFRETFGKVGEVLPSRPISQNAGGRGEASFLERAIFGSETRETANNAFRYLQENLGVPDKPAILAKARALRKRYLAAAPEVVDADMPRAALPGAPTADAAEPSAIPLAETREEATRRLADESRRREEALNISPEAHRKELDRQESARRARRDAMRAAALPDAPASQPLTDPATTPPSAVTEPAALPEDPLRRDVPVSDAERKILFERKIDGRPLIEIVKGYRAEIAAARAGTLNKKQLKDATNRFGDNLTGEMDADALAIKQVAKDILADRGITSERATGVLGALDTYLGAFKQKTLLNPITGPRYIIGNQIGDSIAAVLTGNAEAAFKSWDPRNLANAVRDMPTQSRLVAEDLNAKLGLGRGLRKEIGEAVDKAQMDLERGGSALRRFLNAGRKQGLGSLARPTEYLGRVNEGLEQARRSALWTERVTRELPAAVDALRQRAQDLAANYRWTRYDGLADRARGVIDDLSRERGGTFDAVTLRDRLEGLGREVGMKPKEGLDFADRLARDWQGDVSRLSQRAQDEVNRVFFTYRETNLDAVARRTLMFHYWATRASALYLGEGIRHPGIANAYFRAAEEAEKAAEGLPDPVKGFFKLMNSPAGYTLFWQPQSLVSTFLTFRDQAPTDATSGNALDKALKQVGGFISPLITVPASMVGLLGDTYPSDPLASWTERNLFGATINYARSQGWLGLDPTIPTRPYEQLLDEAQEWASGMGERLTGGMLKRLPAGDAAATSKRDVNAIIQRLAEERGVPIEEAAAAQFNPESDLFKDAYERWAKGTLVTTIARLQPVRVKSRVNAVDEINAEAKAGDPTARLQKDLSTAASAPVARGITDEAEYKNIGTQAQRDANALWASIVYGESPPTIAYQDANGATQFLKGSDIAALGAPGSDQRKQVADGVLASRGEAGIAEPMRAQRDAFEAANPAFADYKTWQGNVPDEGAPLAAYREDLRENNPNAARAIADQEAYLRETEGLAPGTPEYQSRLDGWTRSQDLYNAIRGVKTDVYDPNPTATRSAQAAPPFDPAGAGGGTGAGDYTPFPGTADPVAQLRLEQAAYMEGMDRVNAAITQAYGEPFNWFEYNAPDQMKDAVREQAEMMGVPFPTPGQNLTQYWEWKDLQPPTADASIEAFARFQQGGPAVQPGAPASDAYVVPGRTAADAYAEVGRLLGAPQENPALNAMLNPSPHTQNPVAQLPNGMWAETNIQGLPRDVVRIQGVLYQYLPNGALVPWQG